MKELTEEKFKDLAIKFLLYSLEFPNHITYDELAKKEKEICNEKEFTSLIRYIKINEIK